jgi:hypothetical protein
MRFLSTAKDKALLTIYAGASSVADRIEGRIATQKPVTSDIVGKFLAAIKELSEVAERQEAAALQARLQAAELNQVAATATEEANRAKTIAANIAAIVDPYEAKAV